MQRLLVLVRHGQSEGNAGGVFTGWNDPLLTSRGVDEAKAVARVLKGLNRTGFAGDPNS